MNNVFYNIRLSRRIFATISIEIMEEHKDNTKKKKKDKIGNRISIVFLKCSNFFERNFPTEISL
jgi:hypothetical protein